MRLFPILLVAGLGQTLAAGIPSTEERRVNSTLNPAHRNWTAKNIRPWPPPKDRKPPIAACYRYDFVLPAKPRKAFMSFLPNVRTGKDRIVVNGQVIDKPFPGRPGALRLINLTHVLRQGTNVLAVKSELPKWILHSLMAEGVAFGADGSVTKLMTDATWRTGWDLPEGWDSPDAGPEQVPKANVFPTLLRQAYQIRLPHCGPIRVEPKGMRRPIFDEEQPVELQITLLNQRTAGPASSLQYEVFDEQRQETVGRGEVALKPAGELDLAGLLHHDPLPAGAYELRLVLTAGEEEIDRRNYEIASVGTIEQRLIDGKSYTDGMQLREVWTIDCTAQPKPGEFIAVDRKSNAHETVVKEGAVGKYRTFVSNRHYQNFAYRYKVRNLYSPHLVEIEWPDDAQRGILVQVYEGTTMFERYWKACTGGFQRGETSIVCTREHPGPTNKMRKLYIIYWPNEEEASVHIWNTTGGEEPAAASRITVHEITNDLPALRIADAGDRLIGYHTERGPATMSASYYAGPIGAFFSYALAGIDHPELYRNWYTTTENMIKRMRFAGQNVYLMGHFMYRGTLYPSKRYIFAQNLYRGGDASADYCSLILRMFGRNGLHLVSGIEYVNTPDVLAESSASLDDVIQKGAPTLYTISKDAKLSSLHGGCRWQGLNYFHPRVQESILTIVDELLELYRDYPAWRGIAFILSRNFGPMTVCNARHDSPLNYGYEDYTVELFQKETGVRVPVGALDAERFRKRYGWLMANAKKRWVDWRSDQYTKLFRTIRDRIVRSRSDLKLYLLNFEPMNFTAEAESLFGHFDDEEYLKYVVKQFGFDMETLTREPGMVVSYSHPSPGTGCTVSARNRVYRDLVHNQTWHDLFANDGRGGSYIWSSIPHYGPGYAKGQWLFEWPVVRQGYFWPRHFSDTFTKALVRSNPTWMPHTWMDVAESGGRLHDLRQFARAYRSLPNGRYIRLTGDGLDKNLWVETAATERGDYGYAANAHWWTIDVALQFASGVRIRDLIRNGDVPLPGGKWTFRLGPYEVRPFQVTARPAGGAPWIRSAAVRAPDSVRPLIARGVQEAQSVVDRAKSRVSDLAGLPGWECVARLEKMLAQTKHYLDAGDLGRAYELATSWSLEEAQERVIAEALEAIPFLVLGPFGAPASTATPPQSYYEVVPEYRGLRTPYLGEFYKSDASLPRLTGGFRADPSKAYTIYPGKQAKWQPATKSEHLSFYGLCHSEHPLWMVAYAYTEVYSPTARDATVLAGSDHALAIWLNDDLVLKHGGHGSPRGGQRPSRPDQNRAKVKLAKGWNRLLVKAVQRGRTRIFFRIADRQGRGIDDLRFRLPRK